MMLGIIISRIVFQIKQKKTSNMNDFIINKFIISPEDYKSKYLMQNSKLFLQQYIELCQQAKLSKKVQESVKNYIYLHKFDQKYIKKLNSILTE